MELEDRIRRILARDMRDEGKPVRGIRLEAMGADSICVKDMAGLLAPYDAYDLVKALKAEVKAPIHLHSHFTSGMSSSKINSSNVKSIAPVLSLVS